MADAWATSHQARATKYAWPSWFKAVLWDVDWANEPKPTEEITLEGILTLVNSPESIVERKAFWADTPEATRNRERVWEEMDREFKAKHRWDGGRWERRTDIKLRRLSENKA
jgi:acyl-ACP thioesterase